MRSLGRNRSHDISIGSPDLRVSDSRVRPADYFGGNRIQQRSLRTLTERKYSARVDGSRHETGWKTGIDGLTERVAKEILLEGLNFRRRSSRLTHESTLGVSYFCTAFSAFDLDHLTALIDRSGISEEIYGIAEFDASHRLCYKAFWASLTLRYILTDGYILSSIPDSILDFGISGDYLANASPADLEKLPWPNPGYFSHEFDSWLLLEERLADISIPPDLRRPTQPGEMATVFSPARQLIAKLPTELTKINRRDTPAAPSSFTVDDPRWEYPDLAQVLQKVSAYCLNRNQRERKWMGFSRIGFTETRPDDALYLSAVFCSALMGGAFDAYDMKVAADGTGEFAVNVMVPCRGGKFRSVVTAWNIQRGKTVALSSAYVESHGSERECIMPDLPPFPDASVTHWEEKYDWVRRTATDYGLKAPFDGRQGLGWLWVPHGDALSKEFAAWHRANHDGKVFRRSHYGGRCTLVSLGLPITSIRSVVAATRMAQVCRAIVNTCG